MIDFRSGREPKSSSFDYIQIRIASPEEIRGPRDSKERERLELQGQRTWWSWGEVTKPETINYRSFKAEGDAAFRADIGAPAIRSLLERINVDKLADELRESVATETSQHRKKQMLKRLKIVDAMRNSAQAGEVRNDPRWMILDVVPVIPPDLRPLVPLDGGRFATSDLNDLYRRVINRNNRLQKLILHRAPEVI